jgi:hypothetical protein
MTKDEAMTFMTRRGLTPTVTPINVTATGALAAYEFRLGASKFLAEPNVDEMRLRLFVEAFEYGVAKANAKRWKVLKESAAGKPGRATARDMKAGGPFPIDN